MKKHGWLSVLTGFILLAGFVCSANAAEQPPEEIRIALGGAEVLRSAFWEGPGSAWFLLISTPEGSNELLCFEHGDGGWVRSVRTGAAVPQGAAGVQLIHVTDQVQDLVTGRTWPGPVLMILTDDGSYTSYRRSGSGQWELFKVFWQDEQVYLDFEEESVTFRTPIDQDHSRIETVYGRFERDLRETDLSRIPRTPAQAREMSEEMQPATE